MAEWMEEGRVGGGGKRCWVGVGCVVEGEGVGWVVEGERGGGLMIYYRGDWSHDTGAKHLLSCESVEISFSISVAKVSSLRVQCMHSVHFELNYYSTVCTHEHVIVMLNYANLF